MNFFYHTALGAIYFWVLLAVCLIGLWRGNNARLFATAVLAVFLCDRTLLALTSGQWMMMWGGVVEFGALLFVFAQANTLAARAMIFLFAAKVAAYIALNLSAIDFNVMAAWTEVFGYLQLIIILGSSIHGRGRFFNRGRLEGIPRFVGHRGGGMARDAESRGSSKRHS